MQCIVPSYEPKLEELAEIYQGRDCSIFVDLICLVSYYVLNRTLVSIFWHVKSCHSTVLIVCKQVRKENEEQKRISEIAVLQYSK